MYCLSIKQPWLSMILYCGKDVENRTWRASNKLIGKRIALHASKQKDKDMDMDLDYPQTCGAILGIATIKNIVDRSDSKWFEGPFGIILDDVVALKKPIYCKGKLGFWIIDKQKEEQIKKELECAGVV